MQSTVTQINTLAEFTNLVNNTNKNHILCDFYADWCGPCKNIAKVLPDLYYPYVNNFEFIKIDIDNEEFSDLVASCDVKKIPTFVAFKSKTDNLVTNKITTANPQQLKDFVNSLVTVNTEGTDF